MRLILREFFVRCVIEHDEQREENVLGFSFLNENENDKSKLKHDKKSNCETNSLECIE